MKQKRQIIALVILVFVAALVWGYEWKGQPPSDQTTLQMIQQYKGLAEQDPRILWAKIEQAQKTEYKSNGRNPFSTIAVPRADVTNRTKPKDNTPPPTPPPPPPVPFATLPPNLKYFGFGTIPVGSPRRAFLTDGEDIYIVPEGDTLLGRYRILRVGPANLEFQEISSGLHGIAPLEEQAAPPSMGGN